MNDYLGQSEMAGHAHDIGSTRQRSPFSPLLIQGGQDGAARGRVHRPGADGVRSEQSLSRRRCSCTSAARTWGSRTLISAWGKPTAPIASRAAARSRSVKSAVVQLAFFMASWLLVPAPSGRQNYRATTVYDQNSRLRWNCWVSRHIYFRTTQSKSLLAQKKQTVSRLILGRRGTTCRAPTTGIRYWQRRAKLSLPPGSGGRRLQTYATGVKKPAILHNSILMA